MDGRPSREEWLRPAIDEPFSSSLKPLPSDWPSPRPFALPPPPPPHWKSWFFWCGTPERGRLGCAAFVLLTILLAVPLVLVVISPALINMFFSAATFRVLNATLADPTSTKLYCEIWAEINNGGPFPEVTLTGFNATLLDLKGRPIGWINYPTVTLNPNGPTIQRILSYLTVIDEEAFHEEGRKLMHGEAIEWDVRGESMVWALGFPFRLQVEKRLSFDGALLDNFRATNLMIRSANVSENTLELDAEVSFLSVSNLEFLRIGTLEVELWYNSFANDPRRPGYSVASRTRLGSQLCAPQQFAAGGCSPGAEVSQRIGVAYFYDFKVRKGAIGTPRQPSLRAFVKLFNNGSAGVVTGRWASQTEQTIMAVGPTNKWFLNRIWQGLVTLEGAPVKIMTGALGTRESFVQGYNVFTGQNCDFYNQGADVCDKGAIIMAKNPFGRQWQLRDIEYDVHFAEQYEYDAGFHLEVLGSPVGLVSFSCGATDAFARMVSKPGMWGFAPNHRGAEGRGYTGNASERLAARLADEAVPLPPGGNKGTGTASFFLAATPIPGVAEGVNEPGRAGPCVLGIVELDPFDCCMTTAFTAAVCKAAARGRSHIDVVARGRATLEVDGLRLEVYPDVKIPLSYSNDVLDFNAVKGTPLANLGLVSRAGFNCDDIRFKGVSAPLWPEGKGRLPPPPAPPPPPAAPAQPPAAPPSPPCKYPFAGQGAAGGGSVLLPVALGTTAALLLVLLLACVLARRGRLRLRRCTREVERGAAYPTAAREASLPRRGEPLPRKGESLPRKGESLPWKGESRAGESGRLASSCADEWARAGESTAAGESRRSSASFS